MELPFLTVVVLMAVASSPAPREPEPSTPEGEWTTFDDRKYLSTIWLEGPDRLRVRGYWGPFYRTQTWRHPKAIAREDRP